MTRLNAVKKNLKNPQMDKYVCDMGFFFFLPFSALAMAW